MPPRPSCCGRDDRRLELLVALGRGQEGLLEGRRLRRQPVQPDPVVERQVADLRCVEAGDDQLALRAGLGGDTLPATEQRAELVDLGRVHEHRLVAGPVDEGADRTAGDHPAASDHDQLVGEQRHLGEQVAGDEHRAPLARERLEELPHPLDPLRVEPVGRLVEDQGVRVAEQRAREAQPLAHAHRERLRLLARDVGEAHQPEHLVDPAGRDPVGRGQHPQVVACLAGRVERLRLQQRPDVPHRLPQRRERLPVERRAPGPVVQLEHQPHRGRLAGPVGTEEPGHAARTHLEREVPHRRLAVVRLRESPRLDQSHGGILPVAEG